MFSDLITMKNNILVIGILLAFFVETNHHVWVLDLCVCAVKVFQLTVQSMIA